MLSACWSNICSCVFFHPSHKPRGNSSTTFGSGTEPFCTCGPSSPSAFHSSCMLPWGQPGIWGRIWGGLDVVPSSCMPTCKPGRACRMPGQAYRLSGPNVHSLALTYIWLVTCLWAQPALLKHTFDLRFMQGVKQRTMMLHVELVDDYFISKEKDSTHCRQPIPTATTENVTKDSNVSHVYMFIINSMQKPFPLIYSAVDHTCLHFRLEYWNNNEGGMTECAIYSEAVALCFYGNTPPIVTGWWCFKPSLWTWSQWLPGIIFPDQ